MQGAGIAELFGVEQKFDFAQLLLRDVYDEVYSEGLPSERLDWDNLADATGKKQWVKEFIMTASNVRRFETTSAQSHL